jgi:hypothetical protein
MNHSSVKPQTVTEEWFTLLWLAVLLTVTA